MWNSPVFGSLKRAVLREHRCASNIRPWTPRPRSRGRRKDLLVYRTDEIGTRLLHRPPSTDPGNELATGLVNSCPSVGDALRASHPAVTRHQSGFATGDGSEGNPATSGRRSGSPWQLRDFAVLLIDAARSLGFAARFASGYLAVRSTIQRARKETQLAGRPMPGRQIYLPARLDRFRPRAAVRQIGLVTVAVYAIRTTRSRSMHLHRFPSDHLGMEVQVSVTSVRRDLGHSSTLYWPQIRQSFNRRRTRTRYLDGMQRHSLDQLPSRTSISMGLCAPVASGLMPPLHGQRIVELRLRVAKVFCRHIGGAVGIHNVG